jgi:predicted membrane protein
VCVIITTLVFCCHVLPEFGLLSEKYSFSYFLFLRVVYSISLAPTFPILDGIALNYLIDNGMDKADFGHLRLYGAYGWAVVSFLLGLCIDYFQTRIMYLFITALLFSLVYCLIVFSRAREGPSRGEFETEMDNGIEMPSNTRFMAVPSECYEDYEDEEHSESSDALIHSNSSSSSQAVSSSSNSSNSNSSSSSRAGASGEAELIASTGRQGGGGQGGGKPACLQRVKGNPNWVVLALMLFSPVAIMFVILHTVLSGVSSIVENLVFLFFENSLGASNLIMGFSVVVTVVFEIPMFAYSSRLLEICGQNTLLMVACVAYCVRVIGYTLAPDGVWVLLCEPLHGVAYAGSKMATVAFVADLAPDHMQATAQGILTSLSAVGKLVGTSAGGYVEEKYGANVLYRGSAALMMVFLIAFIVVVLVSKKTSPPPPRHIAATAVGQQEEETGGVRHS